MSEQLNDCQVTRWTNAGDDGHDLVLPLRSMCGCSSEAERFFVVDTEVRRSLGSSDLLTTRQILLTHSPCPLYGTIGIPPSRMIAITRSEGTDTSPQLL